MGQARMTRRDFLRLATIGSLGVVVMACGGAPVAVENPTTAPATGDVATSCRCWSRC